MGKYEMAKKDLIMMPEAAFDPLARSWAGT